MKVNKTKNHIHNVTNSTPCIIKGSKIGTCEHVHIFKDINSTRKQN